MVNILKHVDILELVTINIFRGTPTKLDMNPYIVDITCLDSTKRVVIDTRALQTLNAQITERTKPLDPKDPRTVEFIKEFVGKMLSELNKNGLAIIENIPDSPDDPYKEAKNNFKV